MTTTRYGFLLMPEYSMMAFAAAVDQIRMANRLSEKPLYQWVLLSENGAPITASNRLTLDTQAMQTQSNLDAVFVCGGTNIKNCTTERVTQWLRKIAQQRIPLGAICTGTYVLAQADLLGGYRCTIHWENIASLNEEFPDLIISQDIFELDRDRYTCSGGVSSMDLMLNVVTADHGTELARDISEHFVLERVRTETDAQRPPLHYLIGAGNQPKLVDAVAMMEANIEEPLGLAELAGYAGVSRRQLERLFQDHLHCTPLRYYLDLRLNRGRLLLLQTTLPISKIAMRCGFSSATWFGKRYAEKYGKRPSDERRAAMS